MGSDAVFLKMVKSANFQKPLLERLLKTAQNPSSSNAQVL